MTEAEARPRLARKLTRFAVTGLLVTGVHVLITILFMHAILPSPPLANGVAFTAATSLSYLINTKWSFSSSLESRNLYRFFLVSVVGLTLASGISALAEHYQLHYGQGLVLVVCVVPLSTFLLHHFWTYNSR